MLAILYLVLACFIGFKFLKKALPQLFNLSKTKSLFGNPIKLDNWMVTLPSSFLVGTLIFTWFTYIAAYAFHKTENPLLYGNVLSLSIFIIATVYVIVSNKEGIIGFLNIIKQISVSQGVLYTKERRLEAIFVASLLAVSCFLMFHSFNIRGGIVYIGHSVVGDFGPHLAMIRSFSQAANIPTEYPLYPSGQMRYHFLFFFLVGNLEFLGMRLDWAFNIPSILSLVSFLMLLYSLAIILMGEKWIGAITCVFFFFRSSFAFFTYIAGMNSISEAIPKILSNNTWIGRTTLESWGLWTLNVPVNQRHLAFALGILILILILVLPLFKKMVEAIQEAKKQRGKLNRCFTELLLKKDAWFEEDKWRPVTIGFVLGLISFWNGAVVVAALIVLFFIALCSKHRLEFLTIAIVAIVISLIETRLFIGSISSAVEPRLTVGFLAARKDIFGILAYYIEVFGILPFVVIVGLFFAPKGGRWLALAFCTPLILATLVQLTPNINNNNKFIIISVLLLNIIAANFLYRVFTSSKKYLKAVAAMLFLAMTITGVVDNITLYNKSKIYVTIKTDDPIILWAERNTGPKEIFLTDIYWIHPIFLAGRKIFLGWLVYPWAFGYDTDSRWALVKEMYSSDNIERVEELINRNKIRYIVIDNANRSSKEYTLNEKLIKNNFELVFENGETTIYKTY
jgi:hypothetical protein